MNGADHLELEKMDASKMDRHFQQEGRQSLFTLKPLALNRHSADEILYQDCLSAGR